MSIPLIPLPASIQALYPRILEMHTEVAWFGFALGVFFGLFLLVLWVSFDQEWPGDKLARRRIKEGYLLIGGGFLFLAGGLYIMAILTILCMAMISLTLIDGIRILEKGRNKVVK